MGWKIIIKAYDLNIMSKNDGLNMKKRRKS